MDYKIINIRDFYNAEGEEITQKILSHFKCELNPDIEKFLKNKAIEFYKRGMAETFLVTAELKNKEVIVRIFFISI